MVLMRRERHLHGARSATVMSLLETPIREQLNGVIISCSCSAMLTNGAIEKFPVFLC